MAANGTGANVPTGRRKVRVFDNLISPIGENVEETPVYSPSRVVNGSKGQPQGQANQTEYAKNERRGG